MNEPKIHAEPSKEFLEELNRLTEDNNHGLVYERIAEWCQRESMAVKEAYEEFNLFRKLFHTMNQFHKRMGYFNHGDLRYEVGKQMRGTCARVFGQKVAAQIDAAC